MDDPLLSVKMWITGEQYVYDEKVILFKQTIIGSWSVIFQKRYYFVIMTP